MNKINLGFSGLISKEDFCNYRLGDEVNGGWKSVTNTINRRTLPNINPGISNIYFPELKNRFELLNEVEDNSTLISKLDHLKRQNSRSPCLKEPKKIL